MNSKKGVRININSSIHVDGEKKNKAKQKIIQPQRITEKKI